jgi:DNA invertase Pin-like site-specific DNA recombinase
MRVVAYVREPADPAADRPAFAQQEEIRRHAAAHGLEVVAVCQDLRLPGRSQERHGYLSLLGVLASGRAEGVLLPGLATLSSDVIVQEILLWDLRARGVQVLSSDPVDLDALTPQPDDPTRRLIRDVLARVAEHAAWLATTPAQATSDAVVVQLVSPPNGGDAG